MKRLLLTLLRWHALVAHAPGYDTWHESRFLERWADPRAVAALRAAFAHYDREDLWQALSGTMDLFRWVAQETAGRLEYPYPTQADAYAADLVQTLYADR
jgi:aminoglycoside 6-adenylyltransferase